MKPQAVTVSVNYADFLVHTLEENHKLFDKWVIVTDTKDTPTKELCDKYSDKGVICIQTDIFYSNGASFNKFKGINEGLKYIDRDKWVLFLDSDIVIHDMFNHILKNISLDESCIYGLDRLNCKGLVAWNQYKKDGGIVVDNWLLHDSGLKFGSRLVHYYGHEDGDGQFAGWNPIGFFQLAHPSAFSRYPDNTKGADHCDIMFARLWPRDKRIFIPETLVIHLESADTKKADNWYGRKSSPFLLETEMTTTTTTTLKTPIIEIIDMLNKVHDSGAAYRPGPKKKKGISHHIRKVVHYIKGKIRDYFCK